jgi:alanine racemase
MSYAIQHIARIVGGKLLNEEVYDHPVEHLLLDSRRIVFPESSIFFAIRGSRHDGHDFISDVFDEGVRHFVVTEAVRTGHFPGANFLKVNDAVAALQGLAAHHRRRFDIPVIGITGSNGKTIVKEWLYQLLHEDYYIVRSPGSYNSQVGVPLSVWQLRERHELGIFEAGISRMGEMARLAPVIDCTIGLLTNIGSAHSEGFPSMAEKLRQKLQLFRHAEIIFCCIDDPLVDGEIRRLNKPLFTWSRRHAQADLYVTKVERRTGQTHLEAIYREASLELDIPFTDAASIENALHCWSVLLYLEIAPAAIRRRMAHLTALAMRLELKEGINGCIVINDSYNADLNALTNALNFLDQQRRGGRRTLILSDILESGLDDEALYRQVARLIREKSIDRVLGIGDHVAVLGAHLGAAVESRFFASTRDFLEAFDTLTFEREVILLKGARPFSFERIAGRLAQQVHMTTLEIDLDALVHNLNVYHRRLHRDTRIMVMVKASAYGSGSLEVAKLLEFHRVAYLAVAYADEGVELRQGGVQLPILILNAEPNAFDEIIRFQLEPELYSLSHFRRFADFTAGREAPVPVHLKLDTGMHRLGFEWQDIDELCTLLGQHPQLHIQSIFSHLAASEAPEHDDFTQQQVQEYKAMYEEITRVLPYRPLRHILKSSGIVRFPQHQLDMVRLGLGIYGSDVTGLLREELLPVFRLKAHISQIKKLKAGQTVGYGRQAFADHERRIATITVGYADGLSRAAGNGRFEVQVRGRPAPITGNVCMDMCMIDITNLPEAREGDEVIIFGAAPTVEALAAVLGTIPYEVLTSISRRVRRVYVQE